MKYFYSDYEDKEEEKNVPEVFKNITDPIELAKRIFEHERQDDDEEVEFITIIDDEEKHHKVRVWVEIFRKFYGEEVND